MVLVVKVIIDFFYVFGEYEVWCMDNFVFDLIIGEVDNVRKLYDLDLEWKLNIVFIVEMWK